MLHPHPATEPPVSESQTSTRSGPGDASAPPEMPIATLERSLAHSAGLAAENAAMIQQQDHVSAQATLNAAVERLLAAPGGA